MDGIGASPFNLKADDTDPRGSLRHVLAQEPTSNYPPPPTPASAIAPQLGGAPLAEDVSSPKPEAARGGKQPSSSTRRTNKDGNVSSVYSGNRLRFLKKEDGEPLWRVDIQFLFLKLVFEDDSRVFTKYSDGTTGHTFADIYIDAMAKSSKCSQILKDKLLSDRPSAVDMAMICLLVNVGRMNTTLNFFPEMRARVRTYHPIPSLQAKQSQQAYKQLQDGPRLKSILKGACEGENVPSTPDEISKLPLPRTNPVNLIFVLSQYAPKVSETHFLANQDFFDIFIRTTISSRSRATAFLWLLWWYLEGDFTVEAAARNPFGNGTTGEEGGLPVKVPTLEVLTEEEASRENVDTEEEIAFGEAKKVEREAILANDMPPTAAAPKRGTKTAIMEHQHNYRFRVSPYGSSQSGSDAGSRGRLSQSPQPEGAGGGRRSGRVDRDATRSPSPPSRLAHHQNASSPANPTPPASSRNNKGLGRGNYPRKTREAPTQPFEQVHRHQDIQPMPPPSSHQSQAHHLDMPYQPRIFRSPTDPELGTPMNVQGGNLSTILPGHWVPLNGPEMDDQYKTSPAPDRGGGSKRSRLPTAHQQLLERSRRDRITYVLDRSMRATQRAALRERHHRGVLTDAWVKCHALPDGYDTDEDELGRPGGVDDIGNETGLDAADITRMALVGSIGTQEAIFSRAWRRVGKSMGIKEFQKGARRARPSRAALKMEAEEDSMMIDEAAPETSHEVIVIDDNDGASTPAPSVAVAPARKRAPAKRKSRAAAVAEDDAATPSGRRTPTGKTGSTRRRATTTKKPGSEGVPLKEWNGKEETPTAPGKRSRGVKRAAAATGEMADSPREEAEKVEGDVEELDAKLLDDAAEVEDGEGGARGRAKGEVTADEEAAELLMGMTGMLAGNKEHGAALMADAEKVISGEGQGDVVMGHA